jgi:hypothetical protein
MSIKDRIYEQTNIVEIAVRLGVQIVHHRGDYSVAVCPFHDDHTGHGGEPNLSLLKTKNTFHCFKCQAKGDAFKLWMYMHKVDFKTALREIADWLGVKPDKVPRRAKPKEEPKPKAGWTINGVEALHKALIGNSTLLKTFMGIRKIPVEYVIAKKVGYDAQKGAFVIPILDGQNVIGVRYHSVINRKKKFGAKGYTTKVLYDLNSVRKDAKEIYITEGEGDLWTAEGILGLNAVTAPCGAGAMAEVVQSNLELFQGKKVVLMLDNDGAGLEATAKIRTLFPDGADVHRIAWPQGIQVKDISEWINDLGRPREELMSLIQPYSLAEARQFLESSEEARRHSMEDGNPIKEKDGCYWQESMLPDKPPRRISNFVMEPKWLLKRCSEQIEHDEVWLRVNVVAANGFRVDNKLFSPDDLSSRATFIKALKLAQLSFMGSDSAIHYIKEVLSRSVPTKEGVDRIGFFKGYFVGPGVVWNQNGPVADPPVEYLDTHGIYDMLFKIDDVPIETSLRALTELLPITNRPPVIVGMLGWVFACFLKSMIKERMGYFPILICFGSSGGGKTSLAVKMLELFGVYGRGQLFSAHMTRFTAIKTMASSDVIPMFIDEIKGDIGIERLEFWKSMIRSAYFGEVDMRGRSDLSIVKLACNTPLALVGEMAVIKEVAAMERTIQITFDESWLSSTDAGRVAQEAWRELKHTSLAAILPSLVTYILREVHPQFDDWLSMARADLLSYALPKALSPRAKDNLTVIMLGLRLAKKFVESHGKTLPLDREQIRTFLNEFCNHILELKGRGKRPFDSFLEQLSIMERQGLLKKDVYMSQEGNVLFIHLPSVVAVFRRWAKDTRFDGEVFSEKEYSQAAKELLAKGDYVKKVSVTKRFGGTTQRVVEVDLDEASESGLDVSGFMKEDTGYPVIE